MSGLQAQCLLENVSALSSAFWTLTYKDAPEVGDYRPFQNFMKRYREWNRRKGNFLSIRFFSCGEYGGKSGRFHHHALIFNGLHPDRETLATQLWPQGFVQIGTVTPASVSYTVSYCTKFQTKKDDVRQPFGRWSLRPVLGASGMTHCAEHMRRHKIPHPVPMNVIQIEGRKFPLNKAMKKVFMDTYYRDASEDFADYVRRCELVEYDQKTDLEIDRMEARSRYWNLIKLLSEKV